MARIGDPQHAEPGRADVVTGVLSYRILWHSLCVAGHTMEEFGVVRNPRRELLGRIGGGLPRFGTETGNRTPIGRRCAGYRDIKRRITFGDVLKCGPKT